MLRPEDGIYGLQASLLKTMASPRRLELIHLLSETGPLEVRKIAEHFGRAHTEVMEVRRDLGEERTAREAAEQQLRVALTAGLETNAAEIRHLDLSGLRWQSVGAATVVVGVVVEGILG